MPKIDPFGTPAPRSTLATATLPPRVRRVLEQLFALVSDAFARDLERLLGELEQELFNQGERARNPALQGGYMDTLRTLRLHRSDIIPQFLASLESALSQIRTADRSDDSAVPAERVAHFQNLQLLDDQEASEDTALRLIAVRHESRASLPLMLLGQRFGVLAAAPAFDAEQLPVGPHLLGRMLAAASQSLDVNMDTRLLLYRLWDRHLMTGYPPLVEAMNTLLARENVLPGLTHVPLRLRPTVQNAEPGEGEDRPRRDAPDAPDERASGNDRIDKRRADQDAAIGAARDGADDVDAAADNDQRRHNRRAGDGDLDVGAPAPAQRAYTAWPGDSDEGAANERDHPENFALLQKLLSGRREMLDKLKPATPGAASARPGHFKQRPLLPTAEVIKALSALQDRSVATPESRSVPDIHQTLLAQGRQQRGEAISLSREDSDTFELLGMLYTQIGRELREGTPTKNLLGRLQVPLLRLALQDREFFDRQQHPARQLLGAVADAGANWLSDDETDPKLNLQLQSAVEHVVQNYDGDASVFDSANQQLQQHLQAMARKAEVSERRHVEAARGKEKLEIAKQHAAAVIDQALDGQQLPRFVRTLLCQAWADVLTLVLLREGEQSLEWRQHEQATHQMIAIASRGAAAPAGLAERIEHGLNLVGYHAQEAASLARRLTSRIDDESEDPASRTELAMKLKASARLGEQQTERKPPAPPRTAREQDCYDKLRTLPFGTWLELVINQQGDVKRRRLAWYSVVTGHALFVNQRGQRVDEQSLDSLSRLMAQGQLRVVTAERGRLVNRAWHATMATLRNFGKPPQEELE